MGRSASGRKSLARLPRCAPASDPWRHSASGPTRSAAVASSGVVTVSTTRAPAAWRACTTSRCGQAEGEADHGGRVPQDAGRACAGSRRRPSRARPAWPRAPRPRERGPGGSAAKPSGSAVGRPGRKRLTPNDATPAARTAGHLVGQGLGRLVAAGQEAQGAGARTPPRPGRRSKGHRPWGRPSAAPGRAPAGARRPGWRGRRSAPPRRTSARYGGQLHGVARPGHHAALDGGRPLVPPRTGARRGARTLARHRPFRPFGRQPPGLAGDRGQGPGQAAVPARPLPPRLVRVPGHGRGRDWSR